MDWDRFNRLPRTDVPSPAGHISVIDVGAGPTAMLLHGNPTWSYQWRDLIPSLSGRFRCAAPDLVGFGRSDKAPGRYSWELHSSAVDAVSKAFPPGVVVGHDWGGALGAWLAIQRPERVTGLVLMEPQLLTESWDDYEGARRARFEALRDPATGVRLIQEENAMVEQIRDGVLRGLSSEEMEAYRHPFPDAAAREPIRRFVEMKPIGDDSETFEVFRRIEAELPALTVPVLLLTVEPGAIMRPAAIARARQLIPRLEVQDLGPGLHHFHEDHAERVSDAILEWSSQHGLDGR